MNTLDSVRILVTEEEAHPGGGRHAFISFYGGLKLSIVAGPDQYSAPRRALPALVLYDRVEVAIGGPGNNFIRPTEDNLLAHGLTALVPYAVQNDDVMAYVPMEAVLSAISGASMLSEALGNMERNAPRLTGRCALARIPRILIERAAEKSGLPVSEIESMIVDNEVIAENVEEGREITQRDLSNMVEAYLEGPF